MITITKNGNAVLFEFEENQHYLYNGTIEVPLNSLSLVTDESEMFTFKKAATNDIFISARYDDVNMSKSQLIDFYIANMVGSTGGGSESGITSGDVESMIETSLEDYYDIDEIDAALSGKADTSAVTAVNSSLTAHTSDTDIHTTAVEKAAWNAKSDFSGSYNDLTDKPTIPTVPTSNTAFTNDAGYITDAALEPYAMTSAVTNSISAATDDMATKTWVGEQGYITGVDLSNYATNDDVTAAVSGKADSSSVYTKSEVDTALSGKQDVSGMTAYTTSSDVESYVSGYTYDKATIDSKVASGGTFDPTNYYDKTATDALLDDKFDASAFTSYSSATDARISEDEEVTAAAFNALNDELSGKQDTLSAGTGIDITDNVISAEGGGGKAIEAGRGIAITTGETADTVSFNLPIYSGTGEGSIIGGFSGNTASGKYSIALGGRYEGSFDYQYCKASGKGAISFGGTASGQGAFSCGENPQALGFASVAFGDTTKAIGVESFVIGRNTTANTFVSFAQGMYTKTTNAAEVALGEYNNSVSGSSTWGDSGNTLFSVGNGTSDSARHNAFEIRQNGDIYINLDGQDVKLQDQLGGGSITIDQSLDSGSTNPVENRVIYDKFDEVEQVTAAALNALNDKFDGLRLKKLTQAEYEALTVKDNNTLYILVG